MPNTINLRLLDNKNIIAEMNGIPLAQENSYKIIAGEENATVFKIVSKPNQYVNARYTVEMVNSQGYGVIVPDLKLVEEGKVEAYIENDTFQLPVGMAVSGYGYILIKCYFTNEEGKEEVIPFMVLKIKVWNTLPNWKDYISEGSGGNIDLTPYQKKTDNSLETESKEIVGAINEVNQSLVKVVGANVDEETKELTIELKDKDGNLIATTKISLPISEQDLSEYVKFTDYPTSIVGGKAGVIKVDTYYGFKIGAAGSLGALMPIWATNSEIDDKSERRFINPKNFDYTLVKSLTTNANTLTDEQKAKAQEWLGISGLYKHLISFDFEHAGKIYKMRFEYVSSSNTPLTSQTFFNEAKNTPLLGIGRPENDTEWLIMTMLYCDWVGGEEVIWFTQNTSAITSISLWTNFTDTVTEF